LQANLKPHQVHVMALISVTRLHLRSGRFFLPFLFHAVRSQIQAKAAAGNHGVALRRTGTGVYWTLTVWTDKAAMRAFMLNGPHRTAMPRLAHWCDEAAVAHWEQDNTGLPSWTEAEQRLAADGRVSAVNHPSAAHTAGRPLGSSAPATAPTALAVP
jgi:hypothetical protein